VNPPKDPILAAILSGLIPGLGQVYCRRWGRGALFFFGALIAGALFPPLGLFISMGVWIWGIVDAYRFAADVQDHGAAGDGPVIDIGKRRFPVLDRRRALTYVALPLGVVALLAGVVFLLLARYGLWGGRFTGEEAEPVVAMIEAHRARTGSYPDSLAALIDPTDPLEKKRILDSWGSPYLYRAGGGGFELKSAGKDGRPGTEDDLSYHP